MSSAEEGCSAQSNLDHDNFILEIASGHTMKIQCDQNYCRCMYAWLLQHSGHQLSCPAPCMCNGATPSLSAMCINQIKSTHSDSYMFCPQGHYKNLIETNNMAVECAFVCPSIECHGVVVQLCPGRCSNVRCLCRKRPGTWTHQLTNTHQAFSLLFMVILSEYVTGG